MYHVQCTVCYVCNLLWNPNPYIFVFFFLRNQISANNLGYHRAWIHCFWLQNTKKKMRKKTFNTSGLNLEAAHIYYDDIDEWWCRGEKWKTIGILWCNRNMMMVICWWDESKAMKSSIYIGIESNINNNIIADGLNEIVSCLMATI